MLQEVFRWTWMYITVVVTNARFWLLLFSLKFESASVLLSLSSNTTSSCFGRSQFWMKRVLFVIRRIALSLVGYFETLVELSYNCTHEFTEGLYSLIILGVVARVVCVLYNQNAGSNEITCFLMKKTNLARHRAEHR